MKISVITVCRNSAETIETTIKSVLSQNYPFIEYIVVDGKSTDHTMEIISKYNISKIISEKDNGIYDAINKGIKIATGEIIGLLHSDDYLSNENILTIIGMEFLAKNPDAVYSDLEYVDNSNKVMRHWKAGENGNFEKGWMPPHPTFYVRKKFFEQYGLYNTSFRFAGDYELMLRFIHKHKINTSYIPHVTVKMKTGGKGNISLKNRLLANAEDKKAWLVNGLKPPPFIRITKPLSKWRQFV